VDGKRRKPRPRHVLADPAEQAAFKKKLRPVIQADATVYPQASVELWAVDEHGIGFEPILNKVWCFYGHRPTAAVQDRYDWRFLFGFVHPASARTVFHVATTVSTPLFEVELAEFACQMGTSPQKQIVLVLDRARWHASLKLRVPDHLHLLFLRPYSPELQSAEHLCPLTNTRLANRHFATIDDLEHAQAARCVALQAHPDLIRSTTRFHWWPQRIRKRRGPKVK
jgi:transposase